MNALEAVHTLIDWVIDHPGACEPMNSDSKVLDVLRSIQFTIDPGDDDD